MGTSRLSRWSGRQTERPYTEPSPLGHRDVMLGGMSRSARRTSVLSPRTFCTFAREFSSFTRQGCYGTATPDMGLGFGHLLVRPAARFSCFSAAEEHVVLCPDCA